MTNIERYDGQDVKTKNFELAFDHKFEKFASGNYDIQKISHDIVTLTKSKACSVILAKISDTGETKYTTVFTTDPKMSMCDKNPLFTRAMETKNIIISNDISKDPRVLDASYSCDNCPITSMCSIPLISNDIVYGQILLANKEKTYSRRTLSRISVHLNMLQGIVVSAEESNNFKDSSNNEKFLSIVSHGIKTSMHITVNMIGLLKKTTTFSVIQNEYINRILESCEDLVGTVGDCIDFQKIKTGNLGIVNTSFDLKLVMENITDLLQDKIDKKGLYFHVSIDDKIPKFIFGDSKRLKQILMNLVVNAIKYTAKGSIHVNIDIIGDKLQFVVKDTGYGISQEHIHQIFDDYYQINPSFNNGKGLGLSLCKRLVRMMGGDISVVSMTEKPTGSKFTFTLPYSEKRTQKLEKLDVNVMVVNPIASQRIHLRNCLHKWNVTSNILSTYNEAKLYMDEDELFDIFVIDVSQNLNEALDLLNIIQKKHPRSRNVALNCTSPILGFDAYIDELWDKQSIYDTLTNMKSERNDVRAESEIPTDQLNICIVEDDESSAYALKEILKSLGVLSDNIQCVDSGEQAVRLTTHSHFDLIFIDCRLKGEMNGIIATNLIKKQVPYVKMYGISAELRDDEKVQWMNCGLEGLLMKPFDIDAIEPIITQK